MHTTETKNLVNNPINTCILKNNSKQNSNKNSYNQSEIINSKSKTPILNAKNESEISHTTLLDNHSHEKTTYNIFENEFKLNSAKNTQNQINQHFSVEVKSVEPRIVLEINKIFKKRCQKNIFSQVKAFYNTQQNDFPMKTTDINAKNNIYGFFENIVDYYSNDIKEPENKFKEIKSRNRPNKKNDNFIETIGKIDSKHSKSPLSKIQNNNFKNQKLIRLKKPLTIDLPVLNKKSKEKFLGIAYTPQASLI